MSKLNKIMEAYYAMVSEKKLDKVDKKALSKDFDDRKDKDIDNDGDVDSSDEYLHTRRKTVKKAIKKDKQSADSEKEVIESDDYDDDDDEKDEYKGKKKKKDSDDDMEEGSCSSKKMKESVEVRHSSYGHGEVIEKTDKGYNIFFEHGVEFGIAANELTFLEGKTYKERTKGAAPIDKWSDKLKGKPAKDMAKDLDMTPDLVQDEEEGHDDALDAARVVKSQAPTRGGEKRIGDKSVINKPKDFTKKG